MNISYQDIYTTLKSIYWLSFKFFKTCQKLINIILSKIERAHKTKFFHFTVISFFFYNVWSTTAARPRINNRYWRWSSTTSTTTRNVWPSSSTTRMLGPTTATTTTTRMLGPTTSTTRIRISTTATATLWRATSATTWWLQHQLKRVLKFRVRNNQFNFFFFCFVL